MLGPFDTILCVLGVPVSFLCTYEVAALAGKENAWSAVALFLSAIALFMFAVGVGGLWGMVARVYISEAGISYRTWRLHHIPWHAVTEVRFPIIVPQAGFTPRVFIRTRQGKTHLIPAGADDLRGFFNPLAGYKEKCEPILTASTGGSN